MQSVTKSRHIASLLQCQTNGLFTPEWDAREWLPFYVASWCLSSMEVNYALLSGQSFQVPCAIRLYSFIFFYLFAHTLIGYHIDIWHSVLLHDLTSLFQLYLFMFIVAGVY
jgi:hypothetical protein